MSDLNKLRASDAKGEFFVAVTGERQNKFFRVKERFFKSLLGLNMAIEEGSSLPEQEDHVAGREPNENGDPRRPQEILPSVRNPSSGATHKPVVTSGAVSSLQPAITSALAAPEAVVTAPSAVFTSEPVGAEVFVDGVYMGTTPTAEIPQTGGHHVVKMKKTGFVTWSGGLESKAGNLDKTHAELKIDTDPTKPKIAGLEN